MRGQLPDFVIIGAPKAATTWLTSNLRAQPRIFMPQPEIHYFNRNFSEGVEWYRAQFAEAGADQLVGEKSATYLASPEVPERLRGLIPNARLIVQLRNPVERAYSDYCMLLRRGEVGRDIEAHLDPAKAAAGRFVADGEYARHIAHWLDCFPREQFLILLYDEIRAKPGEAFEDVSRFLSLKLMAASTIDNSVKVKGEPLLPLGMRRTLAPLKGLAAPLRRHGWFKALRSSMARPFEYPPLTDYLRNRLREHYRQDIGKLEAMLGRPIVGWTERASESV